MKIAMPLYQSRRRARERAEQLAAGESIPLTTEFSPQTRQQLVFAMKDCAPRSRLRTGSRVPTAAELADEQRTVLLSEWGRSHLLESLALDPLQPAQELWQYIADFASDEELLDIIEAWFIGLDRAMSETANPVLQVDCHVAFEDRVNEILASNDLAFQVLDREVFPTESMAMHTNVIAPALSLLQGRPELANVERAFHDALSELKPGGNPGDAITDAGTALQEMLLACGASGNALGPLLNDARSRGLLGPYDSKLARGVELIGEWVSAERSQQGDAHVVTNADTVDAWLMVNVVGALIVWLQKQFPT